MKAELEEALRAGGGVVVLREHPRLRHAIRRARECGEVRAVLRGIYAATEMADSFAIRCRALFLADPDAVLLDKSAAIVHGRAAPRDSETVHAASQRLQGNHRGYRFTRRRIAPDHVHSHHGVRTTTVELTVLDLSRSDGPAPLSDALRRGTTIHALTQTLRSTRKRRGNRQLHTWLHQVRAQPWSIAEHRAHNAFRRRRIKGWAANHREPTPSGPAHYAQIDLALPDLLLGFEIDGYEHHRTKDAFHNDRERDVALTRLGWHIVRVSARWVLDSPDSFAAFAEDVIAQRRHLLSHEHCRKTKTRRPRTPNPGPRRRGSLPPQLPPQGGHTEV